MLSIGAFAQLGQVTHRQLRHWDASGLLVPAHVDTFSGYRSYDPAQLDRLHRIVALRQLGFGIDDIGTMLADGIEAGALAEALLIRRDEVERDHRIATARLVDVERRIHLIKKENRMSAVEIIEKPLPALRLAARTATVSEQPEVAGVVSPLLDGVAAAIGTACGVLDTPVVEYDDSESGLRVTAGYAYSGTPVPGIEVAELPAVPRAVCAVHLGSMEHIARSWQALHEEIIARGLRPAGPCRELYVRAVSDDQADWVTELQQPVAAATPHD